MMMDAFPPGLTLAQRNGEMFILCSSQMQMWNCVNNRRYVPSGHLCLRFYTTSLLMLVYWKCLINNVALLTSIISVVGYG